jgi:hypothetical protein
MNMSEQFVPSGYAQGAQAPPESAIAPPITTITMGPNPNFSLVVAFIEEGLDEHYDRLAEEDLESILASVRFPS